MLMLRSFSFGPSWKVLFFFFFLTGLLDPIACSIEGGGVPTQNSGYESTRLFPLIYLVYFFSRPQNMVLVPPPSPLQYSPGFLALHCNFPAHPLYLPLFPPLRPFLFSRPSTSSSAGCHPSSVRRKSSNLPTNLRPMPCCPRFIVQRPNV